MPENNTAKVAPKSDTGKVNGVDDLAKAIRTFKTLGAGGTLGVLAAVFGAAQWVNSKIEDTVRGAVREEVRKEVDPVKERLTRLEAGLDYERKAREK